MSDSHCVSSELLPWTTPTLQCDVDYEFCLMSFSMVVLKSLREFVNDLVEAQVSNSLTSGYVSA
jgi:hypothetical protein